MTGLAPRRRGRRRLALPWEAWPAQDRAAWLAACAPAASPLDDAGRAAAWRPASRAAAMQGYGRWLAFLAGQGALAAADDPAGRIAPERVRAYAALLREGCAPATLASVLARLAMAAAALFPGRDWSWLRAMRAALQRRATPSRRKAGRVVAPRALLGLGNALMAEAAATAGTDPAAAALLHRDGLMVAVLALMPLRRGNLVGLEIGRHLVRHGDRWGVSIPGEETKNHRPLDMGWPEALAPALEAYLSAHRPLLLARGEASGTARLWISQTGQALSAVRLWRIVTTRTRRGLGVAVNPHLFRDCAATALGEMDPEHVRMAAPLLGHGDYRTTERHYVLARSGEALRRHHDAIVARRARRRRGGAPDRAEGA